MRSGAHERAALLGERLRELGRVLCSAEKGARSGARVAYMLDLLDPLGYRLSCAMSERYGFASPAELTRIALRKTPPRRPASIGALTGSELAELVEATFPKLDAVTKQLRAPPPPWHVPTLIAAGLGLEMVAIDTMTFGLDVALSLEEQFD